MIASKVCQGIFIIEYKISVFIDVAWISAKAIMTRYRSYSIGTRGYLYFNM